MGQRPSFNFAFRDQCCTLGGSSLKQRGLAGRRKGDGGAELGFPSNGLYREGAVLSKKVRQMAPNATFDIAGAFREAILRIQSAIWGGLSPKLPHGANYSG